MRTQTQKAIAVRLPRTQQSREERKRSERLQAKQKKAFTFTQAQLDQRDAAVQMASSKRALILLMSMPLVALRDEFGFGKKRLNRYMEKFMSEWTAYENDNVSLEDLAKIIETETGLEVLKVMK